MKDFNIIKNSNAEINDNYCDEQESLDYILSTFSFNSFIMYLVHIHTWYISLHCVSYCYIGQKLNC